MHVKLFKNLKAMVVWILDAPPRNLDLSTLLLPSTSEYIEVTIKNFTNVVHAVNKEKMLSFYLHHAHNHTDGKPVSPNCFQFEIL